MTAPNRNVLWGRAIADELAKAGIEDVCIAPGSRSTPLTVAFADHDGIAIHSHLDERSAAFYALGRAKRTGRPTPLVCTSGTAAANFHPAVIEAGQARVPLLLFTADRPPELRDSGANQTIDQTKLYGDAVRRYRELPEPEADDRKLRSLRTTIARAVDESAGTPAGPVHVNVPFAKPLEPVDVPGDVPPEFEQRNPLAAEGRDGPYVAVSRGRPTLSAADRREVVDAVQESTRGLIVVGPADGLDAEAIVELGVATGFPILADPLSGVRFASAGDATIVGGYDSWIDATTPEPDLVLRFGASPTSRTLREYLQKTGVRQLLVDPAGEWREATFSATNLVVADETCLARSIAADLDAPAADSDWRERFERRESRCWKLIDGATDRLFEGAILHRVFARAPDPATVFVSNSMPIRDADRFARPREAELTVLGNRGASGIDGITSTAMGAGSATDDPLVLVIGDIAYYHDMNGLLAVARLGLDATIVLLNNDGGGIFHMLPIERFDPPFSEQFKTPHGLDFAPTGALYGLEFVRIDSIDRFDDAYGASLSSAGTQVIEVVLDGEESHRRREAVQDRVRSAFET